jgi:hypothetical protein
LIVGYEEGEHNSEAMGALCFRPRRLGVILRASEYHQRVLSKEAMYQI